MKKTKTTPVQLRVETGIEFSRCFQAAMGADDGVGRIRKILQALPRKDRDLVVYPAEPVIRLDEEGTLVTLTVHQYTLDLNGPGSLVPKVNELLDTFGRGEPYGPLMLAVNYPGDFRRAAAEGQLKRPRLVLTVCPQGPLPAWLEADLERLALTMGEDQGEERFEFRRHELPPDVMSLLLPATAEATSASV